MNYGRFFSLDLKASSIAEGITVFYYCAVKYDDGDKQTPTYPFYISFTPEGVFFYVHYALSREGRSSHLNSLVFSLPISVDINVKDELTLKINEVFSTQYPYNASRSQIGKYIKDGLISTEDEEANGGVSYSSLEVFGIDYSFFEPSNVESNNEPILFFLRKLFLDFLFDLEHTSIFENAVSYNAVRNILNSNFLFCAIACKAEYFYQRKLQTKQNLSKILIDDTDLKLFYADYFITAEERWVDIIAHPNAEKTFYESGWFYEVEREMDCVYISGPLKYELPHNRSREKRQLKSNETKSCNEYIALAAINKVKRESERQSTHKKELKNRVKSTARVASNWYLQKYDFGGTIKIWYGKGNRLAIVIALLCLFSICAALILPSFGVQIPVDQIVVPLDIFCVGIALWLCGLLFSRRRYIKRIGLVNSLMPRLIASILAAWFTLAIGEDIFKGFFDSQHDWRISLPLLAVIYVFIFYEITKISPYLPNWKKVSRSALLLIISFIYAFTSGIMIIHFFGGNYLERSDYIDEFYVNNVFPHKPEFIIDPTQDTTVLTTVFYNTIERYDDSLIDLIADKVAPIMSRHDSGYLSKFTYTPKADDKLPEITSYIPIDDHHLGKKRSNKKHIDYKVTVILANKFSHTDTSSIAVLNERMLEGSTIAGRVRRVEEYCREVIRVDSIDDVELQRVAYAGLMNQTPMIDSVTYVTTNLNMLKSIGNDQTYRSVLKHLRPVDTHRRSVLRETRLGIRMFRDMLLQFTFFAMFIGIFIQLIFEEKTITEPV